jgi:hypothetical protein
MFGPKRDEVRGMWKKNFIMSSFMICTPHPILFRVIKSRRMRLVGHVAWMGEGRGVYRVWWGNLRDRDHWGDPGIDRRIIFRWIFKK